jgi:hypothetical protein
VREIKFRAWDKKNNAMLYQDGLLVSFPTGDITGFYAVIGGMYPSENSDCMEVGRDCFLMQFTGLRDKNGKEIYEGDILAHRTRTSFDFPQGEVIFRDGGFVGHWLGSKCGGERLYPRLTRNFQVIGNIYENPEILASLEVEKAASKNLKAADSAQ